MPRQHDYEDGEPTVPSGGVSAGDAQTQRAAPSENSVTGNGGSTGTPAPLPRGVPSERGGSLSSRASSFGSMSLRIVAVEIENFKGVGHPIRIGFRPITLLFGSNSSGKSTVLHALCYAHEILIHGNVDARKTSLGGDQIDLGGFRTFVHAHDLERSVRLRFDLNLESWQVPEQVRDNTRHSNEFADEWIDSDDPAKFAKSGWVTLVVAWREWEQRAVLASYEIGVNGNAVGRIVKLEGSGTGVNLEFNWAHALFEPLGGGATVRRGPQAGRTGENADASLDRSIHRVEVSGQTTPLPDWDVLLPLEDVALRDDLGVGIGRRGSTSFLRFQWLMSGLFVGIGRTLRDELVALRYVGPMRELRPPMQAESGAATQEGWSDGTAAWGLLLGSPPSSVVNFRELLREVNEWLGRGDRLDTGYRLRRRVSVELPADGRPLVWIRLYARLCAEHPNEGGGVDLGSWVRKRAAEIADVVDWDPGEVEARIRGAGVVGERVSKATPPIAKRIEAARDRYRFLVRVVELVDGLKEGRPAEAIRELVGAIAVAPARTTLQLVTVESELSVRTADVGVGISQILPVVVAALDVERPGITAIEQPELHVHPRLQVELGDLFAQGIARGGVFLLETHSEHLMLRLLRRIEETSGNDLREGKPPLRSEQVSVVFLEQVDSEVRATPLRIDETGEFMDRWPQGFFDERADELF